MPLAPVDLLATIIPPLRAAQLGGLDRLTVDAHDTGRGRAPSSYTRPLAQYRDHLGPRPIVAPLHKMKVFQSCGTVILYESLSGTAPSRAIASHDDDPNLALSLLPRHRYRATW